jgi:hypothetical protein
LEKAWQDRDPVARRLLPFAALAASLVATALLTRPPDWTLSDREAPPMLPRPEAVRLIAAPFLHLVADYYWVMTTHQVGISKTPDQVRHAYTYGELLTELDPKFRQAYYFVGAAIVIKDGEGRWRNTHESTRMLEKGLVAFPEYVFLRILLAYNLTQFENEPLRAAKILEEASRLPDAPEYVGPLATRLYAAGGKIEAGLELAGALAEQADDEQVRATYAQRVLELQLERELTRVDAAIGAFRTREGREPVDVAELVSKGDLNPAPMDPLGGQIVLRDGRAFSTSRPKRLTDFLEVGAP